MDVNPHVVDVHQGSPNQIHTGLECFKSGSCLRLFLHVFTFPFVGLPRASARRHRNQHAGRAGLCFDVKPRLTKALSGLCFTPDFAWLFFFLNPFAILWQLRVAMNLIRNLFCVQAIKELRHPSSEHSGLPFASEVDSIIDTASAPSANHGECVGFPLFPLFPTRTSQA